MTNRLEFQPTCIRETTFMFATAAMTAPDGRCKTLDAAADGYVRAEACVVVKLE